MLNKPCDSRASGKKTSLFPNLRLGDAQETREALGIRLEGAVLVIDEAHNLVDAVNGAHSAVLTADAAAAAASQLDAYWTRFSTRLAPGVMDSDVTCPMPDL